MLTANTYDSVERVLQCSAALPAQSGCQLQGPVLRYCLALVKSGSDSISPASARLVVPSNLRAIMHIALECLILALVVLTKSLALRVGRPMIAAFIESAGGRLLVLLLPSRTA